MKKASKYTAKLPDSEGRVAYTEEENAIWQALYQRQMKVIPNRVHPAFMRGLQALDLPSDRVPQPFEVSTVLQKQTGWVIEPVPALINFDRFFRLLADRHFPAASFIRTREELDYLQEPDIFHEIFGHCPMLTYPHFADFTANYGATGVDASKQERVFLARLYWFTVEFGLIDTRQGLRIYGGGIASSPGETIYALESDIPERRPFDVLDVLRTPYRIDEYQKIYYVIERPEVLYDLAQIDLMPLIHKAMELGEFPPAYIPKQASA